MAKTIPTPLAELEQEVRRAAAARQFSHCSVVFAEYCRCAAAHVHSLPPDSELAAAIRLRAQEVLEWSTLMLRVARNSIADHLAPLPLVVRYVSRSDPDPRMRIHG
jgi:hypothetical protein